MLDAILSWFSPDVGVVVTGRKILVTKLGDDTAPQEVDATAEVVPPRMPPSHLPAEVRDGLTTRRHLSLSPPRAPLLRRGLPQQIEAFEACLTDALRQTVGGGRMWIKPRVVVATRYGDNGIRKRVFLDLLERAGARRIYVVQYPMCCAIGMQLNVVGAELYGVLAMEADWSEFAVISYADQLCELDLDYGLDDLVYDIAWALSEEQGGNVSTDEVRNRILHGDWSDDMAQAANASLRRVSEPLMAQAANDLRDEQYAALLASGIHLCGEAASLPGIDGLLASRLGCPVHRYVSTIHPAVTGIGIYLSHLYEWKATLESVIDQQ